MAFVTYTTSASTSLTSMPQWQYVTAAGSGGGGVTYVPPVPPEDEIAWLRRRVSEVTRLVDR